MFTLLFALSALIFYYKPLFSLVMMLYYTSKQDEESTTKYKAKIYDWAQNVYEVVKW